MHQSIKLSNWSCVIISADISGAGDGGVTVLLVEYENKALSLIIHWGGGRGKGS